MGNYHRYTEVHHNVILRGTMAIVSLNTLHRSILLNIGKKKLHTNLIRVEVAPTRLHHNYMASTHAHRRVISNDARRKASKYVAIN